MSILIGFTCLLLAGFLLAVPSRRKLPNRFLAAFLILTAVELSAWLWVDADNYNSWANAFRLALGKLQMPVFLGIFLSSCYADFRLRWRDSLHLIPMMTALLLSLPGSQIPFLASEGRAAGLTVAEQNAIWMASHLLYYGYMIAVGWVLLRFWRLYRSQHSAARSETLYWLVQLATASFVAHSMLLVRDALIFTPAHAIVLPLQMFSALIALGITTWIALKSLLQPGLFRNVDQRLLRLTDRPAISPTASLSHLEAFMMREQPYLDAELSLAALSDRIAMTPRELSELLNQSAGMHFFDYVNRQRVEHAKILLRDSPDLTVLQIVHDSGFNSKSSFNTAFKKHVGLTPSAFRAQHLAGAISSPSFD